MFRQSPIFFKVDQKYFFGLFFYLKKLRSINQLLKRFLASALDKANVCNGPVCVLDVDEIAILFGLVASPIGLRIGCFNVTRISLSMVSEFKLGSLWIRLETPNANMATSHCYQTFCFRTYLFGQIVSLFVCQRADVVIRQELFDQAHKPYNYVHAYHYSNHCRILCF